MEKPTFSTFPPEIHVSIAEHCGSSDLLNLCFTSKWVYERCLRVLYRHVDLEHTAPRSFPRPHEELEQLNDVFQKQQGVVNTLLRHPEYGKHVRSWNGALYMPTVDLQSRRCSGGISEEQLWRAVELLTHVESVRAGTRNKFVANWTVLTTRIPAVLFPSATSVTLVGYIQSGIAKSILQSINPALLRYICLDFVRKCGKTSMSPRTGPWETAGVGRVAPLGVPRGLLMMLTGRCTALRTLTLRRLGQIEEGPQWNAVAEEASYVEWAHFIRSVRGTVQRFTFEQIAVTQWLTLLDADQRPRIMDEKFQRIILPAILSGDWPRLTAIKFRGSKCPSEHGGADGLISKLQSIHVGCTDITVEEEKSEEPPGLD
ncbi:hypothetical protein MMC07_000592 [Pseudocyphellaria aurata]|nr:hypothetical protein [Pseudocyphellaria aurata]